ncbi:MAG: 30S ribosomal protein S1 [Cytophagales bacterium]|nr:30S ribosomal protein S1 [Cytophagales bacterium]
MAEEKKEELQEEVKAEATEQKIEETTEEAPVATEGNPTEADAPVAIVEVEKLEEAAAETDEASEPVAEAEELADVDAEKSASEATPETIIISEEVPEIKAPVESKVVDEDETLELPEMEEEEIDWDGTRDSGFSPEYGDEERAEMDKLYTETLNEINEKELIEGTVVGITNQDVIINIGFKSDGLVGLTEFRDMPELKAGDTVEVYVEEQENAKGQLILSRRKAKIVKAWELIQGALDGDTIINGMVKRRTKGGLIVDVHGVEAFLPGSQIDVKPIRDFDIFVGKEMEVKVIKINYSNDNVVVSHKVLIEKDLEKQRAEILNNLEKGQVLEGVIKNMTNFGVFIDLGGVDGLLHITDISWGRINHPEDALNLDEKVNVVVLDFDDDKKRISLGMKQLTAHPWDSLDASISEGTRVKGKIVNVADYGAFLEIIPGVEGLIHVSEMSWSQHLRNPSDFMNVGDELEAVVLTIDREERKMSVGIKQLGEDPWTKQDVLTKYAVGEKHSGTVRNLTNFGLFIELEEGIDGLVHVSDLSWTKKIKHPSEFVKVNEELEVVVMELDVENRRLALSHKHLEENPWETFESVFERGSIHKCTIVSMSEKGAVLELPYGIEGHATGKNLLKEAGERAGEGETLDFRVMDFSKEEKRIQLSHTATWKEVSDTPKKKSSKKGNTLDKINKEVEKSTLGDLDALSALKQKMETPAAKKEEKKVEKKVEAKAEKVEAKKEEKKEEKVEAKKEEKKEEKPKAKKAPAAKASAKKKAEEKLKAEKKPAAKKATKKEDKEKK